MQSGQPVRNKLHINDGQEKNLIFEIWESLGGKGAHYFFFPKYDAP
jgi:hypothetical protein